MNKNRCPFYLTRHHTDMNEDKIPENPVQGTALSENQAGHPVSASVAKKSGWLPMAAMVLSVGAWLTLAYSTGYAAMTVAFVAVLLSAFACRRKRGPWRNVAITALIAAAVLMVVVLAFIIVLKISLAK